MLDLHVSMNTCARSQDSGCFPGTSRGRSARRRRLSGSIVRHQPAQNRWPGTGTGNGRTIWATSVHPVQFVSEAAEAEVRGPPAGGQRERGTSLPVVQTFLEACEAGLRGLLGTANSSIVEVKATTSIGQLTASACARLSETASRKRRARDQVLLCSPFAGSFLRPKTKLSFEKHNSLYLANPGATRWSSRTVHRRYCGIEATV